MGDALLTRRPNGRYFLTRLPPVILRVLGTDEDDVYLNPGEPVGIDMCPAGVHAEVGGHLLPFQSIEVQYSMKAKHPEELQHGDDPLRADTGRGVHPVS